MKMVGGGGGANKIVATLRADGKVYPTDVNAQNFANLVNYKIRTEGEVKALNTIIATTTVVDLGKMLLQYARDSDVNGVKTLLSRGAPFTSDWLGMTALHFAAMNNQYEICDLLLKGGINKDSKTKVERTPLHLACFYGHERIVELLLSKSCAVNARDMLRMTPIHWAVEKRHKKIVRLLIAENADITLVSKFGKTPIALAVLTEQADLLEELEAARKMLSSQKYSEQHERETFDAVNSIMSTSRDVIEEPDALRKIDLETEEDFTIDANYSEAKLTNLDNIKETVIFDNSTINLLKSHGISMVQDDDEDASNNLLNTALRNGRQLVLSEGGKLLLNETKRKHSDIMSNSNSNNNNNKSNNNFSSNHNTHNHHISVMPNNMRTDASNNNVNNNNNNNNNASNRMQHTNNYSTKMRPNIISKAKDNPGIAKNKNIRIISLNDFKKLYGNANIKSMQKLSSSTTTNMRIVKNLKEDAKVDPSALAAAERKVHVNLRQSQQSEKLRTSAENVCITAAETIAEPMDDYDPMTNIIQIGATDSEPEVSENGEQKGTTKLPQQAVRFISTKCVEHNSNNKSNNNNNNNTIPALPALRQVASLPSARQSSKPALQGNEGKQVTTNTPTTAAGSVSSSASSASSTAAANSAAVAASTPLLTTSDICRQLLELRKQNEELRRKFDFAQKEKELLRTRLERLEELLLVERSDEDFMIES